MAITSYNVVRVGNLATVTVVSDLDGLVYFHWYRDGAYVGQTLENGANTGVQSFAVAFDEQIRVEVNDTLDPDYDAIANAPEGWPSTRTIQWIRSLDDDVAFYRLTYNRASFDLLDTESGIELGDIPASAGQWSYTFETPPLPDLYTLTYNVEAYDFAGNVGTTLQIQERFVRRPDAPDFAMSYSAGTQRVTFTEAA